MAKQVIDPSVNCSRVECVLSQVRRFKCGRHLTRCRSAINSSDFPGQVRVRLEDGCILIGSSYISECGLPGMELTEAAACHIAGTFIPLGHPDCREL